MTYRIEFEHGPSGARQILEAKEYHYKTAFDAIRAAYTLTNMDNPAWRGAFYAINEKGERV